VQSANSQFGPVFANLTNTGGMEVYADATAFADSSAYADAGAAGAVQDLFAPAGDAYGLVTNSNGTMWVEASAYASSFDRAAYASAQAVGVSQDVELAQNAFLTTRNSGDLRVDADATAFAYDTLAYAEARARGVNQEAFVSGRAGVYTENTSDIFVTADAYAVGLYADAYANATATGVNQDVESISGFASAAVNNSGIYDIIGSAYATAESVYSFAEADAFGIGVNQYVDGDSRAIATVQNSAGIRGEAVADAYSVYSSADANAEATAVNQDVYSQNGTAVAYVNNNSLISGFADAEARVNSDFDASADADALGIDQDVESYGSGLYAQNAYAEVDNSGVVAAEAFADATALEGEARAFAEATGIEQGAYSENGIAYTRVSNTPSLGGGLISAYADASAYAEDRAFARAAIVTALEQDADAYFGNAYTEVFNDGTVEGLARADAYSLSADAYAGASVTAINQDPNSEYGEAAAFVDNSYDIIASAFATATAYASATARANATGIDQDTDAYFDATATIDNAGMIDVSAKSYAKSFGYLEAEADSDAMGIEQDADSDYGEALTRVYNEGSASVISAYATAVADALLYAQADADAQATGIDQNPDNDGFGSAIAEVRNEGQIVAWAFAEATNWEGYDNAYADADAKGIEQEADADDITDSFGEGIVNVFNSNGITAIAKARANVFGDSSDVGANAYADATATAVDQDVDVEENYGLARTTNTGTIRALGDAIAFSAYEDAYADAWGRGVRQDVDNDDEGPADAIVSNAAGALIAAGALATASAWEVAYATASATGVDQDVEAQDGNATATVNNYGSIWAAADARAIGTGVDYLGASSAFAEAWATGINQETESQNEGDATSSVTNTSFLSIKANAYAEAIGTDFARATAVVDGIDQEADAEDYARVETDNSGLISAIAFAVARTTEGSGSPDGSAFAYATASGLDQNVEGDDASIAFLANSGDLYGWAFAEAGGYAESYASARAKGHNAMSDEDLTLDVTNYETGYIGAFASAVANYTANARAAAAWFEVFDDNYLEGTIVNAGNISATAYADGSTGEAEAFGVAMISDEGNNTTLTNTGVISAIAIGPNADATAIAVASHYEEGTGTTTINNDGGFIFAGESGKNPAKSAIEVNGTTLFRGNWLNTRGFTTFNGDRYGEAPNAVVVNLTGGTDTVAKDIVEAYDLVSEDVQDALAGNQNYGYIYGNALLTDDDVINVKDGVTIFDGLWNPDGRPVGTVNIYDEGKLVLVQNYEEGAGGGTVENFNLASDGTLVMELTPRDEWEGFDYSQINAINADVQGKFVALYTAGLYGNTMFYDNIINADNLSVADLVQGFAEVDDNSALIKTTAIVDNEGGDIANIDLYAERIAFGAVAGMTDNQQAAGDAIEKVYGNIDLDTDFGRLVSQLFTLDDGDYQLFMDQLTGAEHAQHLRSVLWSTRAINRIITERMECDTASAYRSASATSGAKVDGNTVMPTADAPMAATGCFDPGTASVWMRGFGQWNTLDGDENAPGGDETQYGIIFGGDYAFDENWFLGIAGGYFNSDGEFDDWGGRQGTDYDYDGLQLAAYGGYDNSTYYLRGVLSYGNYEGESNRMIAWPGSSPIDPSGDPSSNTFAFYGETGYRFDIGAGNITPFAGLNLATATLESFTEDDPENTGAALEIHDSDANSIASVLGVRFDADMAMGSGIFTPTVSVAWMHEFGDTPEVDMSFASAPSGADFTVVASEVARDSILIDAGAKFTLGDSVDFGVYYNGQFNEDYSSNAITARLGYKF
jgi:outer membrane autotransporter protein